MKKPCYGSGDYAGFPPPCPGFESRSYEICSGQSGTGAGFLLVLRFSLPILNPPTVPHSSSIIRAWYNRPVSGRRNKWAPSHSTSRHEKNNKLDEDEVHTPDGLPPEKKLQVSICIVCVGSRGGPAISLSGFEPKFLCGIAHNPTVYQLSYPGSMHYNSFLFI
jgi:hypothetical protein